MDNGYATGIVTTVNYHSHKKKTERVKKEVEMRRRELEAHEHHGNILYEKVNTGRSYADYYNSTWKLKPGKTLQEYKYSSWQNMRIIIDSDIKGLNDTSKFATRKKSDTIKLLEANEKPMEDETKVETPVEAEVAVEAEAEVVAGEQA